MHPVAAVTSPSEAATTNTGVVVSVRGSVVEALFDRRLPAIHTMLRARQGAVLLEVLTQLHTQRVRGRFWESLFWRDGCFWHARPGSAKA